MSNLERPKVGVGLLVVRDEQILLGERIHSHGQGEFGGPGGHLELEESFEDTILRELIEEAGNRIRLRNLRFLCVTNLMTYLPKHYVDVGMVAEWESGEPIVGEPHKLASWNWYPIEQPPTPLFGCVKNYIEAYKTGRTYFPSS